MSPKMPNSRRNLDLAIERVFDDRETALRMRRVMANVIVGPKLPRSCTGPARREARGPMTSSICKLS